MPAFAALRSLVLGMAACAMMGSVPALAQSIETIDPNQEIDGDLDLQPQPETEAQYDSEVVSPEAQGVDDPDYEWEELPAAETANDAAAADPGAPVNSAKAQATTVDTSETYKQDDLIGAAEGLFGKGAEGLARLIQDILAKQGEPNAYIVGREAGGAFIVGARYGSGTLYHKVEGQMPVYWTGPSIGFDAGANAGNTFVLVYNLFDTEELYERYPAGEGQAYAIGGVTASYLRKGDVVMIPIRVGAGLRLGVNAGYMRFSKKQRWVPF